MRTSSLPTMIAGALGGAATLGGCDVLSELLKPPIGITNTPAPGPGPATSPAPTPTPGQTVPPQYLRTEVLASLRLSPYYQPLFVAGLINDGIGIFATTNTGGVIGARRWGRDYKDPATQTDIADLADVFVAEAGGRRKAIVVLRRQVGGTWLGDFPWRKALVKKGILEEFQREALFEQTDTTWRLAGLSVGTQRPASRSVSITEVRITNGSDTTVYRKGDLVEDRILPLDRLAAGLPGETVKVTVTASGSAEAFVTSGGNRRQQLSRDGTGGVSRFTGDVTFPDVQGIGQLGIDVVATRTLEVVASEYDATIWGVPVVRKGGAL